MVKKSMRKCSHWGHNGHNSRTCNNNGHGHGQDKGVCLKLFGVNIMEKEDDSMKKSYSMGNLQAAGNADHNNNVVTIDHDAGYLSDGLIHNKRHKAAHESKKMDLQDQGLQDSTISPTRTAAETSSEGSSSKVLPQKINTANSSPPQASVPSQILNRFPHLCLVSPPAAPVSPPCNVPNYSVFPYMMGIPENVPYAPMMHFARPSYRYMIKTHGNFATCAPVISHPSGIPSPRSLPSSPSMAGRIGMSSLAEKDALELKIGQPQPSQGTNLSSPTSGAIRVT